MKVGSPQLPPETAHNDHPATSQPEHHDSLLDKIGSVLQKAEMAVAKTLEQPEKVDAALKTIDNKLSQLHPDGKLAKAAVKAGQLVDGALRQQIDARLQAQAAEHVDVSNRPLWQPPTKGEWSLDNGRISDPISFYFHGQLSDIKAALKQSGWSEADPGTTINFVKYGGNVLVHELDKVIPGKFQLPGLSGNLNHLPVSTQSYHNHQFVAAFERNNSSPLGGRDHFRVFDTGARDAQGLPVYAVAASRDTKVSITFPSSGGVHFGHKVEADADPEREYINQTLQSVNGHGFDLNTNTLTLDFGRAKHLYSKDGKVYDITFNKK